MVMTMAGAHRALEALNGPCEFVREGTIDPTKYSYWLVLHEELDTPQNASLVVADILSGRAVRLFVFVCVLSSRCLVCRPSHLCVCRVGTPPARKYIYG